MEKLTGKQKVILDILKKLIAKNGYPPTVREIGKEANLSSPATIHFHLKQLEEKGYIKKDDNKNRTLEILVPNEYLEKDEKIIDVPLLGKVTAGSPIEAIEMPDELFSLPANLLTNHDEVFTLRVSGESMINVGIYDGDILIVERRNTARNGETVVAMNDNNEVTVKTFYKEDGYFRLQPENDTMEPIILKECTILGKAIGLYRKL
ncbi:MAG: transcriptional repressor LexA [Bacilli bacterium]|nr:transcriptional repressor LexA [Bacilli bacterium]MBR6136654.1 transcriptional repressor LexA [Bacilli bacterium]